MMYSGSILVDSWTLKFVCAKDGDGPWHLELRTPYAELITRETQSASPMVRRPSGRSTLESPQSPADSSAKAAVEDWQAGSSCDGF
jgi:hypothetical protein